MNTDYERVARAIRYIQDNTSRQPSLEDISQHVHLSPFHFQRLFTRFAAVTPKQFLQFYTTQNAKRLLQSGSSALEASEQLGLSSTSRLHDHLVAIEAVTPGELKNKGKDLHFYWGSGETKFGRAFVCWNQRGIHQLDFYEKDYLPILDSLMHQWSNAAFSHKQNESVALLKEIFDSNKKKIRLWVKGTNFQLRVWQSLLNIPEGNVVPYQAVAKAIQKPNATRAVASAIANNPIAYFIPCHRVIRSTGELGGYKWETERKYILLTCENLIRNDKNK